MSSKGIALAAALLSACQQAAPKSEFPAAGRDVAPIVGDSFSTEDARDRVGEAMDVAILDHIVMAGTECRSMRQMGLL